MSTWSCVSEERSWVHDYDTLYNANRDIQLKWTVRRLMLWEQPRTLPASHTATIIPTPSIHPIYLDSKHPLPISPLKPLPSQPPIKELQAGLRLIERHHVPPTMTTNHHC